MPIETLAFGGHLGTKFEEQFVDSIGAFNNNTINALLLNGQRYGEPGSITEGRVLEMQPGEYINELDIRTCKGSTNGKDTRHVCRVVLSTSAGRTLTMGNKGSNQDVQNHKLSSIRVLSIGGNTEKFLDKLRIRHIPNYVESELIAKGNAIIGIVPQGQRVEAFTSNRISRLSAADRLLETTSSFEQTTEASAAFGEFSARASTTFGFTVTSREQLTEQLETERTESETRIYEPPIGHVGLEIVRVDVLRSNDGDNGEDNSIVWMFPVAEPAMVTVNVADTLTLTDDLYDLTGQVELHLPKIAGTKLQRNGYGLFPRSTP